jgi:outer membrane protein assembly factor BamB
VKGLADAGAPAKYSLRAPESALGVADANGDGVDDVVTFASVTTDDERIDRLVAFDGKTRQVLWTSEPIRPWNDLPSGASPMIFAANGNVAVSAGWNTVDFRDLKTGAKKSNVTLDGIPGRRTCPDPENAGRWYTALYVGSFRGSHEVRGAFIDVGASKVEPAARPAWCPPYWVPLDATYEVCQFSHQIAMPRSTCMHPTAAPKLEGATPKFALRAGDVTIAVAQGERIVAADGSSKDGVPHVARFDGKRVLWKRALPDVAHPPNVSEEHSLRRIDITPPGILLVIDLQESATKLAGSRVVMLDVKTGDVRWDRVLEGRYVVEPRVVGSRVYLPRLLSGETTAAWFDPEAELDVLDAATGTPLFTLGGEEKL